MRIGKRWEIIFPDDFLILGMTIMFLVIGVCGVQALINGTESWLQLVAVSTVPPFGLAGCALFIWKDWRLRLCSRCNEVMSRVPRPPGKNAFRHRQKCPSCRREELTGVVSPGCERSGGEAGTLGSDLRARDRHWTMHEIIRAITAVHAGIEVAECRFPSTALPPLPAILADGSASGRYIFGDAIPSWQAGLADIEVGLEVDGREIRRGTGIDVMGDPLRPLLWLAEERRRLGEGLRAGEVISTGSMTGMLPIRPSQRVVAHFGSSATVEIDFDP